MDWRAHVRQELRDITGDPARDEEIVEELAGYLAERYAEHLASGATPAEALARTTGELRESERLAPALRRADRPRLVHPIPPPQTGEISVLRDFRQDIGYAARLLWHSKGFAIAAVLTLGLGIGATTAIVSVVDRVLLRPTPLADAGRLMMVWETDRNSGTTREPSSLPDYLDFVERSRQFASLAAFMGGEATLSPGDGDPLRLAGLAVTHGFLSTLGIRPLLGRAFSADEDRPGGPAVVLISAGLWERFFQRRPDVIGRTIRINDRDQTVVGVMPQDADFGVMQVLGDAAYSRAFADRDVRSRVDAWMPLAGDPADLPRDTHPIFVIGRLAPGATRATAQSEMTAITADLERTYPSNRARGAFIEPVPDVVFGRARPPLRMLLVAVGALLLIACVNVANLLLARGTVRAREIAVRTALGAGTTRLLRQFVAENLVLTFVAVLLGVVFAAVGLRALLALAPADIPRLASVAVDLRVFGIALAIAVVTGLVFGLVPVWQSRRLDVQGALKSEGNRGASAGRSAAALRSSLVVGEIALSVVLVVATGLLIKSFWRVEHVDAGFDARQVLKAEFQLPPSRYPAEMRLWPNFVAARRFNDELLRRVRSLPGVETAAIAGNHPLDAGFTNSFQVVGRESEARDWPEISVRRMTSDYFSTVRLALRGGRLFADGDNAAAPPVAVINEAASRRFFAGREALGQQIRFWGITRAIIGVVADERFHGLTTSSPPAVYIPLGQAPSVDGSEVLLVRGVTPPGSLEAAVRETITAIDPQLAVFGMEPLEATVSQSIGQRRFLVVLLAVFASLALTLAAIGIHGVLSYAVASRRREIGIRMALGAAPERVTRLVLGQGLRLTILGVAIGLAGTLAVRQLFAALLFDVAATDVATIAITLPVLTGVALLAAYVPARRAVRVDPLASLREE